jgi:uncharacterized membrane protein YfcA
MLQYLWLLPVGFLLGTFGTLIGAGGGFLLVPLLLLLYPKDNPDTITSISLAVVFFNALSGSAAYSKMKRVDYRSGLLFAVATVPGAVLGAMTTSVMPRRLFDLVFGVILICIAVFLVLNPTKDAKDKAAHGVPGRLLRRITEADGTKHVYAYNPYLGFGLSLVVGYLSSLLGIGGGIIHVPALVHFLNFPVHIATATSHFVLAIMALAGTGVHVATGAFHHGIRRTIILSIGVIVGAQLGARLSNVMRARWIIRCLGSALGLVGVRILVLALH